MDCLKLKIGYYSQGKIYIDSNLQSQVVDVISDYDNMDNNSLGKGLITLSDDDVPIFFQTDLNTQVKASLEALVAAFDIVALPTNAYETELNQKLSDARVKLQNILKIIP